MPIGRKPFRMEIISPEHPVAVETCTFVTLPAWDGQLGVLANHSPLVCRLGEGELRAEVGGKWRRFFVRGGFADVAGEAVVVLTEEAIPADELNVEEIKSQLEEAVKLHATTAQAAAERDQRIKLARLQLHIIARSQGERHE